MDETKMKYVFCLAFLCLMSFAGPGSTEEMPASTQTASTPWTLEDCLRYAQAHSPLIEQAKENVKVASGQKWGSAGQFLPRLSLDSAYSHNSVSALGSLGSSFGKSIRPSLVSQDVYIHSFSASQTLFSWGMKPVFSAGTAGVRRAKAQYRKAANDLNYNVQKAWFAALFTKQSLEIAQTAESVARDNYETSQQLYKEGKVSHFDVSRAKVSWVNARTNVIAAENAERLSQEALRTVLGLPIGELFKPEGQFPEDIANVDVNERLNYALSHRPELEEINHLTKQTAEGVELARAGLLPALGVNYKYSWEGANLTAVKDDYYRSWTAGAFLSIPIFDGGSSWGRLSAAKAGLKSLRAADRAAKDGVALEVRQAFLSLNDAAERLPAQKENVETAQENLRIAQERYALGLLSQLELKDAELSLTQAQTQYAKALFDYNVARAALDRAVGEPF